MRERYIYCLLILKISPIVNILQKDIISFKSNIKFVFIYILLFQNFRMMFYSIIVLITKISSDGVIGDTM